VAILRCAIIIGLGLWLAVFCSAIADESPPFMLSPWRFGAIAWIESKPADWEAITAEAAQAVEDVFALWRLPIPSPTGNWDDPASNPSVYGSGRVPQVIKKDPGTGKLWRLNPLAWGEEETYPLLLILFPDVECMLEATGGIGAGVYYHGSPAVPGSAIWFQGLTGVPRSIMCLLDDLTVLWHELTHWMTAMALGAAELDGVWPPYVIVEGLAEYTVEALCGLIGTEFSVARQPSVVAWASENSLGDDRAEYDPYSIGVSIVSYLVERDGKATLIDCLPDWAADPYGMLRAVEPGWHVYLGLGATQRYPEPGWVTRSVQLLP